VSGQAEGGELGYYSIASAPQAPAPGRFELAVAEDSWPVAGGIRAGVSFFVGRVTGSLPLQRLMEATNVVLVGMGTGVAPLRATAQSLLASGDANRPRVTLVQGARSLEECFFREEFEAMHGNRFEYRPILSRQQGDYRGLRGRVQEHLDDLPTSDVEYFLCGSSSMVDEVSRLLVGRGVRRDCIFSEGY
jgi:NAD(P)H-flavin reductase